MNRFDIGRCQIPEDRQSHKVLYIPLYQVQNCNTVCVCVFINVCVCIY